MTDKHKIMLDLTPDAKDRLKVAFNKKIASTILFKIGEQPLPLQETLFNYITEVIKKDL